MLMSHPPPYDEPFDTTQFFTTIPSRFLLPIPDSHVKEPHIMDYHKIIGAMMSVISATSQGAVKTCAQSSSLAEEIHGSCRLKDVNKKRALIASCFGIKSSKVPLHPF
ncbi:hypothetical protein O6H91_Y563600 [Diphasiastrum complanatum]|nr:hypothetical protein O6H91_Y563600 [Diphasiastrum complanatum]